MIEKECMGAKGDVINLGGSELRHCHRRTARCSASSTFIFSHFPNSAEDPGGVKIKIKGREKAPEGYRAVARRVTF